MSIDQGKNIAAIIKEPHARLTIEERSIPSPGERELVVRNRAIAVNPVDWKIQDWAMFVEKYPNVLGSDSSGDVVAIGPGVTKFKKGDRVAGFGAVLYNQQIDHGSWQTYMILREIATTKIPDYMSYEDSTVFPTAFATAVMALFEELGIPRPSATLPPQSDTGLLIWGAASSVGSEAVQLAHTVGCKVFATASKKNHEWLKQLGATEVFDYRDPDVIDKIVEAAKQAQTPLKIGFDPISEGTTFDQCSSVLLRSSGNDSKLTTVMFWPEGKEKPEGVNITMTAVVRAFVDKSELGEWLFNDWLPTALEQRLLLPKPDVQVVEGGLNSAQKLFDMSKSGVSAKKLVIQVE